MPFSTYETNMNDFPFDQDPEDALPTVSDALAPKDVLFVPLIHADRPIAIPLQHPTRPCLVPHVPNPSTKR